MLTNPTPSSQNLSDADGAELLIYLMGWYLASFDRGASPLVSRKLASALSAFIIHFHHLCRLYVRHLVFCIASGESFHPKAAHDGDAQDLLPIIKDLSPPQLRAALWVVSNLMEDVSKLDLNSEKKYTITARRTIKCEGKR